MGEVLGAARATLWAWASVKKGWFTVPLFESDPEGETKSVFGPPGRGPATHIPESPPSPLDPIDPSEPVSIIVDFPGPDAALPPEQCVPSTRSSEEQAKR